MIVFMIMIIILLPCKVAYNVVEPKMLFFCNVPMLLELMQVAALFSV
jgi:hypothetical protein